MAIPFLPWRPENCPRIPTWWALWRLRPSQGLCSTPYTQPSRPAGYLPGAASPPEESLQGGFRRSNLLLAHYLYFLVDCFARWKHARSRLVLSKIHSNAITLYRIPG